MKPRFVPPLVSDSIFSFGFARGGMLNQRSALVIAILDPAEEHFFQSGSTIAGVGVFEAPVTRRSGASAMPKGVRWIRQAAAAFIVGGDGGGLFRNVLAKRISGGGQLKTVFAMPIFFIALYMLWKSWNSL